MKRSIFITIASVIAIVLIAVWVYILFFGGQPSSEDQDFADLNFPETPDANFNPGLVEPEIVVDVANTEIIRQLTTKPVVGFGDGINSSGEKEAWYVEAGTGHIFVINLETGIERRVSGTTFANIKKAVLTPDTQHVMIETGKGNSKEFILGEWSSSTEEFIFNTIAESIVNFTASANDTFLFTVRNDGELVASQYYPISKSSEILFTIPFEEAVVSWGETALSTHYIYPKASARLEGYLYESRDGSFKRLPAAGRGLSAIGNEDQVMYSNQIESEYVTSMLRENSERELESINLSLLTNTIPDKCVNYTQNNSFICGTDDSDKDHNTPDEWYRGEISYSDDIWEINLTEQSATRLLKINQETGRNIDIINPLLGNSGDSLYFQNKNDQTLWMFTLPSAEQVNSFDDSDRINDDII